MIKTTAMLLEELREYGSPKSKLARMAERGECFPITRGYMKLTGTLLRTCLRAVFTGLHTFPLNMPSAATADSRSGIYRYLRHL